MIILIYRIIKVFITMINSYCISGYRLIIYKLHDLFVIKIILPGKSVCIFSGEKKENIIEAAWVLICESTCWNSRNHRR